MSRLAFFDLASGASGDMILAALAHAGRRTTDPVEDAIKSAVTGLDLGCSVTFERAMRAGLHCLSATVHLPKGDRHDVDGLRAAIERTEASDRAKGRALAGLSAIVGAEARVHGTDPEHVHLHDMGSADTAADLVGAAAGLETLGVARVCAAPVPAPRGWIDTQGGTLPLPSPASLELLRGAAMYGVPDEVELVTPTAAAILVAHEAAFGPMPPLTVEEIGVGGGRRELSRPNVCRVVVGRAVEITESSLPSASGFPEGVTLLRDVLLECNIDDQSPEAIGHALEALFQSGARDAWITPIVMKKSRPAFQLSILCDPGDEGTLLGVLFRHTTTLGARRRDVAKWALDREELHVPVRGANLRVKVGRIGDDVVTISPEFEDCAALSKRAGISLKEAYAEATEHARRLLSGPGGSGGERSEPPIHSR